MSKTIVQHGARDGDRTHAHIRELDLKSNALTTRPPGLIHLNHCICTKIYHEFCYQHKQLIKVEL